MTSSDSFRELAQLLAHTNPQVQFGATNAVLSLSENREYLLFLGSEEGKPTLRNLLRNFEKDELLLVALSALLNVSGRSEIVANLLTLKAPARVVESLNARQRHVPMHCSLLANLSRESDGMQACLEIPNFFRGVFLKFCADVEEQTDALGLVAINCTAKETVRSEMCREEHARYLLLECLLRLLPIRRRRLVALRIFRNLAIDATCHAALVAVNLVARLGSFLYPQDLNRRECDAAAETLRDCVGLATDVETRAASVEILFSFTRTAEGRQGLRDQKAYEYLRLWEIAETDEDVKEKIHTVVNVVVLSEDEIAKGEVDSFGVEPKTRPATPDN